jgi:vacuolar protein sorting-associated protein 13A/C
MLFKLFLCNVDLSASYDREKPPTKGVLVVNTNFVRVKRPISFKLVWSPLSSGNISDQGINNSDVPSNGVSSQGDSNCSIWFPEAPKGYVALGCVVSPGRTQPPLSSAFCILASLVCPCSQRDCITISTTDRYVKFPRIIFLS